jgi:hypothetical protein
MQCTLLRSTLRSGEAGSAAISAIASLMGNISVAPQVGHRSGLFPFAAGLGPAGVLLLALASGEEALNTASSLRSRKTSILRFLFKSPPHPAAALVEDRCGNPAGLLLLGGAAVSRSCVYRTVPAGRTGKPLPPAQSCRKCSVEMSSIRRSTILKIPHTSENIEGVRLDPISRV